MNAGKKSVIEAQQPRSAEVVPMEAEDSNLHEGFKRAMETDNAADSDDEAFSFKFPEINLSSLDFSSESSICQTEIMEKINGYLDRDIADQELLIKELLDFERKIDALSASHQK